MQINSLRKKLARGEPVLMAGTTLGNAWAAEIMASQGFDAIWVDMQHADLSLTGLADVIRGARCHGVPTVVRVAKNDAADVHRALDSGTSTVICPLISTRDDCETFVRACYYPPVGDRSWGPFVSTTAFALSGPDYFGASNDQVLPIAMIETMKGVEAADEILSVPGLGGVYIGTSDLSVDLGLGPIPDVRSKGMVEPIRHVFETARKYGIASGGYCSTIEETKFLQQIGGQLLWMGADHSYMRSQAAAALKAFHTR